jgi:hypothetical protein
MRNFSLIEKLIAVLIVLLCISFFYTQQLAYNGIVKNIEQKEAKGKAFLIDNHCKLISREEGIFSVKTCYVCDNNVKYCTEE